MIAKTARAKEEYKLFILCAAGADEDICDALSVRPAWANG